MIQVNSKSNIPIYEQIKYGIKELIVKGALKDGDKLPSIRNFAWNLTINPNTIKKAYNHLEEEKIITTVQGKGTYIVIGAKEKIIKSEIIILKNDIERIILEALNLDLDLDDVIEIEKELYKKIGGKSNAKD